MIKMIVFDMAGTTVDEHNVVYKTLRTAINEAGFDFTLDQVLEQGAGKEKLQAIKDIVKKFGNNQDEDFIKSIYENFLVLLKSAYNELEIAPIKHAEELFSELKQKHILVVLNTGYNEETARSLLKKLGWIEGKTVDGLVTATDVPNNRPNPDMINLALKKFGLKDASETIKVGDSMIDIEEGQNAGCRFSIGITTGAHTEAQLRSVNPDFIIHDLLELLPIVSEN